MANRPIPVIVIHGGWVHNSRPEFLHFLRTRPLTNTFKPKADWKNNLQDVLGAKYEVILPEMPNKQHARYDEWEAWFERFSDMIGSGAILIGHSLGGTFLAKYLELYGAKGIGGLILVSAPYDLYESGPLGLGTFRLPKGLPRLAELEDTIHLIHSDDDRFVPFSELAKYAAQLPKAGTIFLRNRGHIDQVEFPELVEVIQRFSREP